MGTYYYIGLDIHKGTISYCNELPRSKLRGIKSTYKEWAFRSKLRGINPDEIKITQTNWGRVHILP